MTLFDRKVDLARFTGGTSLYVMCREWMKNNPDADGEVMGNGAHDNRFLRVNWAMYYDAVEAHAL